MKTFAPMRGRIALSSVLGLMLFGAMNAEASGPTVATPIMRQLVRVQDAAKFTLSCSARWCATGYTVLVRSWNGGCERARIKTASPSFSFNIAYKQPDWTWAPMVVEIYHPQLDQNRIAEPIAYTPIAAAYVTLSFDAKAKLCPGPPAGTRMTMSSTPPCVARPGGNPWPDPDLAGCPKN